MKPRKMLFVGTVEWEGFGMMRVRWSKKMTSIVPKSAISRQSKRRKP